MSMNEEKDITSMDIEGNEQNVQNNIIFQIDDSSDESSDKEDSSSLPDLILVNETNNDNAEEKQHDSDEEEEVESKRQFASDEKEEMEGKMEEEVESNSNHVPPLEEVEDDSEPEDDQDDSNAEPGECPFGSDCPVKIAMDNNISPSHVRHDPNIRDHINSYHRHMNFLFSHQYSQMREEHDIIRFVLGASGIIQRGCINNNVMRDEEEHKNSKCGHCENFYDHEDHAKFFMSCCDSVYCLKCIHI